jgi:signal transduction histidine kinase
MKGTDELSNVAGTINGMLAALQQSEAELRNLYKEEQDLRQELQAEITKRVEFMRALVHEVKTPLTPVVTASELLLEELKEEPALSLARSINKGAYNLNERIDELLDLAKGEVDTLGLSLKSVDTMQLLKEIANDMIPVAQHNGQSLNLELPQSLPLAWADEDRLRQVVLNLINNAIKFTPAGGKITLRAKKHGTSLVVEVQDTGHGINKEDQQWLFEPYHQLGEETARRRGLGLGLSLSKKLVELHGGQIWVKSQKGKGSTFGFSIPFEATNQMQESTEAE